MKGEGVAGREMRERGGGRYLIFNAHAVNHRDHVRAKGGKVRLEEEAGSAVRPKVEKKRKVRERMGEGGG